MGKQGVRSLRRREVPPPATTRGSLEDEDAAEQSKPVTEGHVLQDSTHVGVWRSTSRVNATGAWGARRTSFCRFLGEIHV